jgi:hypothetical protein
MISLRLGNQKQGAAVRSYLFHSFGACVCEDLLCPLPVSANWTHMLGWNHFAEPNLHAYFSSSNFKFAGWAFSGVALTIWMFSFCRSTTSTVSFLFPSEWKTLAWKLFHRPTLSYFKVKLWKFNCIDGFIDIVLTYPFRSLCWGLVESGPCSLADLWPVGCCLNRKKNVGSIGAGLIESTCLPVVGG